MPAPQNAPQDEFAPTIVGPNGKIDPVVASAPTISPEDLADAWHDSKMALRHFVPASNGAFNSGGVQGYYCDGPGVSAQTIYRTLRGEGRREDPIFTRGSVPCDADDFGRCTELLDAVPGWRARIGEMGSLSHAWRNLAGDWDAIETAYRSGDTAQTTALIRAALGR